MCELEFVII